MFRNALVVGAVSLMLALPAAARAQQVTSRSQINYQTPGEARAGAACQAWLCNEGASDGEARRPRPVGGVRQSPHRAGVPGPGGPDVPPDAVVSRDAVVLLPTLIHRDLFV